MFTDVSGQSIGPALKGQKSKKKMQLFTDVSGQSIGPAFKGQKSKKKM
jgi:hypothetical protein